MIVLSTKKSSSRIFHGKNTNPKTRKYQLLLVSFDGNGQETKRGGAILIKENFALTAAQLVFDANKAPVRHIQLSGGSTKIHSDGRQPFDDRQPFDLRPCNPCNKKPDCDCKTFDERGILITHEDFAPRDYPKEGYGYGNIDWMYS